MSKKSRWNGGRAYRVHLRRARLHGSKGGNKRERLLRAFSIALAIPGGMVVHPRGREWRASYSRITLAQWRHKHRKHLRWTQQLIDDLTCLQMNGGQLAEAGFQTPPGVSLTLYTSKTDFIQNIANIVVKGLVVASWKTGRQSLRAWLEEQRKAGYLDGESGNKFL